MRFTLPHASKLKSKKSIETLFASGKTMRKAAVRIVYTIYDQPGENQIGFSVSKRFFKKAVDRNRTKRVMREAYRLNQQVLAKQDHKHIHVMFIYQSNKLPDFKVLNEVFPKLLKDLNGLLQAVVQD